MAWGDPYFAWVDEGEAFDPVAHRREDEEVETWSLKPSEDGFAVLTIKVKPPEGGMLRPSRKRWGVFSYERHDGTLVLLARGKVDSLPLGGNPEEAELIFKCGPGDWQVAQDAVLQPTKSGPWWDSVLVDPAHRDDPVEILDGLSSVIDFHPATHECSLHDIFGVGLPVWDIGTEWYEDSLSGEIGEPPISTVEIEVSAQWTQRLSGSIDAWDDVTDAFGGLPSTLTPDDFLNRWPREGDGIGNDNGYQVRSSSLTRVYPEDEPLEAGPFSGSSDVYNYILDSNLEAPVAREISFERAWFDGDLRLSWSAQQRRHERITIRMTSGVQDTSLGNGGVHRITLDCQDVTVDTETPTWQPGVFYAVDDVVQMHGWAYKRLIAGVSESSWGQDVTQFNMSTFPPTLIQVWEPLAENLSPLGGVHKSRYLTSPRGHETLLAAMFRGRAVLADAMRGEVTFEVPLDAAVEAGLRMGMRVRLTVPTGYLAIENETVEGKVGSYELYGSATEDVARITIRPALGSDKSTAAPGGSWSASQTGEPWDRLAIPDLSGLPVRAMATGRIIRVRVENTVAEQAAYIDANDYSPPTRTDPRETDPGRLLGDVPTIAIFDLEPLTSDDEFLMTAAVDAMIPFEGPRQIDLGGGDD